ncbi:MAG: hypothetical protein J7J20_02915 [Desulfurococcales archaeon]|nr:hypothetical protein [Desulfurococcales archaeon]
MGKRKEKETGKIIKKKKVRKGPSLRLKRVRWDIVAVIVIIAVIAYVGYNLVYASMQKQEGIEAVEDISRLYEGLEKVVVQNNSNVSIDLWYYVRGDVPCGNYVMGVKDFIQVRIFYYEVTIPAGTKVGNETTTENKTISGYHILYLRAPYLIDLLMLTGVNTLYGYTDNISNMFLNYEVLNRTLRGNLSKELMGSEVLDLGKLGNASTIKIRYTYSLPLSNTTAYSITATVWYENKFKLPVKLILSINGSVTTIELRSIHVIER